MNGESIMNMMDEGFLQTNTETLELLSKAMTAGQGVDAASFSGGRALSLESLDQTLVNILHTQDEAVLFQRLKKQPIKSVVHQWDERTEVGSDDGAWVPEGGSSDDTDQTIARKFVTAKYLQTKRTVTLQASLTNMIEDAMALEENAGTLWLIRNIERALFEGDSAIVAEQPDGLKKMIPSTHVIDLRGEAASSTKFEDAIAESCRMVRDYYGKIDLMLSSTMIMQDVQSLLRDRIRFQAEQVNGGPGSGVQTNGPLGGSVFTRYPTPFGTPVLKEDIFIKESTVPRASILTTKRPAKPVITSLVIADDAASKFAAGDAGDYYYTVVAMNKYGDSIAADVSAVQSIAAGKKVTITITAAVDVTTVTGYKIYRSAKGGANTDLRFVKAVPATDATTPTVFVDLNEDLPGCSDVFMLTTDPLYNALEWAQFLPMMKFNLYPTSSAVYPFLMLLFGALAVKKPVNHVRIKNVAPSTLTWY